jgi:hypothetical protein
MELVRGRTLADIVRNDGPMGPEEATVIGLSVCRALGAVHAAGLVHRDVKAQNVMREAGGRIVLMDFGAGWEVALAARSKEVLPTGTPLCMAPELFAGRAPSIASDIYSVGVLLFHLVTGTYPVQGRTITDLVLAHGLGRRRLLSDLRPDLPDPFLHVVESALSRSPEDRPASAGALLRDLSRALPGAQGDVLDPSAITPRALVTPAPVPPSEAPAIEPGSAAVTGPAAWPRIGPWAAGALAVAAGTWLLGLLASLAFDLTLGRGEFSSDTPADWLVWGLRSLVLPLFFVLLAMAAAWAVRIAWIVVRRVPIARRVADRVAVAAAAAVRALRLETPRAAGQAIVVAQLAALGWFCVHYAPLILAFMSSISTYPASRLEPLAPVHESVHDDYRTVLPLIIAAMTLAWWRLWRWQRGSRLPGDRATGAVGLGLIVAAVVLLALPYRILRHNVFPRVLFAQQRCYAIGERGADVLLHCPEADVPRNRVVRRDDPRLERTSAVESIFTPRPASTAAPPPGR